MQFRDFYFQSKFTSLSLAFKTDSQTLEKRLEIQDRSRDIAEQNVDKELKGLRSGLAVSIDTFDNDTSDKFGPVNHHE